MWIGVARKSYAVALYGPIKKQLSFEKVEASMLNGVGRRSSAGIYLGEMV
jgi:hypothetical protein